MPERAPAAFGKTIERAGEPFRQEQNDRNYGVQLRPRV